MDDSPDVFLARQDAEEASLELIVSAWKKPSDLLRHLASFVVGSAWISGGVSSLSCVVGHLVHFALCLFRSS